MTATYVAKLTHAQRLERRKRMVEQCRAGRALEEVAAEFGVCVSTIYNACNENFARSDAKKIDYAAIAELARNSKSARDVSVEHGIKYSAVLRACHEYNIPLIQGPRDGHADLHAFVSREQWNAVDWTLRNTDIALKLGVTRERVRQVRNQLSKPKSRFHHNHRITIQLRDWLDANRQSIAHCRLDEIQSLVPFSVHIETLKTWIEKLGIDYVIFSKAEDRLTRENIREFVDETPSGCWEWKGSLGGACGYARVGAGYGHHFSFRLFKGEIPEGLWVLHTCDNPKCINPEHLYAGTAKDNAQDRLRRGRDGVCTLTPDQVREVRRLRMLSNWSIKHIAEKFGVNRSVIYGIVRDRTYQHVTDAA